MALAFSASPAPAGASTIGVNGGTLRVDAAAGEATLLVIKGEGGLGGPSRDAEAVFGFPRVFSISHLLGPTHGHWQGAGPAAGAGCAAVAGNTGARPGPHLACRDVQRIALDLGSGDDYAVVNVSQVFRPECQYGCAVPTTIDGGAGDDGLHFVNPADNGTATLDGGSGNDSILFAGVGSVNGGPGDDFINLDHFGGAGDRVTVDCGPGNDRVRAWFYEDVRVKPQLDTASCPPILTWRGAVGLPPAGVGLGGHPPGRITRNGRMKLPLFKATGAVRGTVRLHEAVHKIPRSDSRVGFPIPGTGWKRCGAKTIHFNLRAGRYLRVNLPIVRSVIRRAKPRDPVPCTFRVAAVDRQGERFHEEDATVWLRRGG
jgi:hypothetical protein